MGHLESKPNWPLVSIITAVKNGEKHLEQCILSVLGQTYRPLEFIIVDGGSTDGTLAIIRRYDDKITHWISEPDKNHFDAMNKGSRLAQGEYSLYLNSDDYFFAPNSIESLMSAIAGASRKPLLVAGRCVFCFEDELLPIFRPPNASALRHGLPHQATLIHRRIYKEFSYNASLCVKADTDLWHRLREEGLFEPYFVPATCSVFRVGGVSTNLTKEFSRCIENQVSLYLCSKRFSVAALLRGAVRTQFKKLLYAVCGQRVYYRRLLPVYFKFYRR